MQAPTLNRITQAQHGASKAVDHSAKDDPYIYAPENGTIDSYQQRGSDKNDAGNCLRMTGSKGLHQFAHLERSYVKKGDKVVRGQKIAKMGYTGYTIPSGPAGAHLHYWILTPNGYIYPPKLYKDKFRKESDMLTAQVAGIIVRFYSGRTITPKEYSAYVGKVTPAEFIKIVKKYKSYLGNIEDAKAGKLSAKKHLPYTIRSKYKHIY